MRALLVRVYERSGDDNVFFLASGLTFGVMLAGIPFLLLLLSLPHLFLGGEVERFQEEALRWLWRIVPVTAPAVRAELREQLRTIVDAAGSIGLISALLFAWFSTRLFGALRTALNEVFDIEEDRGVIRGKLSDLRLVVISSVLLCANIAATATLGIPGVDWLTALGIRPALLRGIIGFLASFATVYVMFLLIYKFVPGRRLHWRTAAVAALFASLGFELLKLAFGWYVARFADYSVVFFGITTVVVLVLSIYYASILFLLGGEVAQAYELHRTMQRQREILD